MSGPKFAIAAHELRFFERNTMNLKCTMLVVVAAFTQCAVAAPTLHTTDFITPGQRTNLVDFEPIGDTNVGAPTFTQDGVTVNQVNGEGNDIWTSCTGCWFSNNTLSWYPNGGDFGWTEIVMANGADFNDIGVDLGSGFGPGGKVVEYELLLNGSPVLSGLITTPAASDGYIGFSGGGFDQVRLRNPSQSGGRIGDGRQNALAIDNVELAGTAVPEPGSVALLAAGLLGIAAAKRRRS